MAELTIGAAAPDFQLEGIEGSVHLRKMQGLKHVVLYFYPKDDTPG